MKHTVKRIGEKNKTKINLWQIPNAYGLYLQQSYGVKNNSANFYLGQETASKRAFRGPMLDFDVTHSDRVLHISVFWPLFSVIARQPQFII